MLYSLAIGDEAAGLTFSSLVLASIENVIFTALSTVPILSRRERRKKLSMTDFQYESVPEGDIDEEKTTSAITPTQSHLDTRDRFRKTIFAGCVFVLVWSGVIFLLLTFMPPYDKPKDLLDIRQALVSQIPMETVLWTQNDTYAGRASEASNRAWDLLIPPGHGFILISKDEARQHALPPGIFVDEAHDRYSISMYHQIHCLGMIRLAYFAAVNDLEQVRDAPLSASHRWKPGNHDAHIDSSHLQHCFDYLRQSIFCAGDTTLEWARDAKMGKKPSQVNGWGIEHRCRSSEAIYNFTAKNRAENDAQGIVNAYNE